MFRHPCPYVHQQNGKVERKHPSIVDVGITVLAKASLHLKFWWEAFESATYLLNRLPTVGLHNLSPFEVLFGHLPNYNSVKVFGCVCYPYLITYNPHKLHSRTFPCLFLGYSSCHKGYKCFHEFCTELNCLAKKKLK